ncbi:MAG: tRNA pseudouridine(55) synthase TruB [Clostridia bacterium]|nr:tRNA pseudouridine(55) synthase TruB [Clostridia bacterium]
MNAFISLLKPPGLTSAAAVGACKRLTGEERVGHAGTLDPEACGVLPIMIGRAARLFDALVDKEKTYVAECAFGAATDTQDASGRVIARGGAYPDLETVRQAAARLTGDVVQRPSVFSAIKQGGKPLYARARAGEQVEAPERTVRIERIEVLRALPEHGVLLRVDCGRGTYIRTLCHDLGALCGCPAHMRFLLRARTGFFSLDNAVTLEELSQAKEEGRLSALTLPPDAPLRHLPEARVGGRLLRMAVNGMALPLREAAIAQPGAALYRVYAGPRFLGLAAPEEGLLKWRVVFPEEDDGCKSC